VTTLDFFTGLILFGFLFGGYSTGLIQSAGSLVGLLLGTTLAGRWYVAFTGFLNQFVGGQEKLAKVLAYALIVLIVARLFGIALALFLKVFKIFSIVPGLKGIDKLGGTLVGFIEGSLLLGLAYGVALNLFGADFQKSLDVSKLAPFVQQVGGVLLPLLPEALKQAQGLVPPVNLPVPDLSNVNLSGLVQ
jgi:uncharacterized membrane protein required for colicin V production